MKQKLTHYDKNVVLKRNNHYVMTRVNAYKRYIHTIKPLNDLIKILDQ